jgi:hypothetical protein
MATDERLPVVTKLEFGKIYVIIHEISPVTTWDGKTQYRVAFHVTDYETGRPIKTPVAHVFIDEPKVSPEEMRGLPPEDVNKLWQQKFIDSLREKLLFQIELYRQNRHAFTL